MMKKNNKQQLAFIFVGLGSSLSLLLGIIIPFIGIISSFLGKYAVFFQFLFISGAIISASGILMLKSNIQLARNLIFFGGLIGILINNISLIGLKFLRKSKRGKKLKKKFRKWLILPILCVYATLILFIIELEDRLHIPFNWFGRDGLDFSQTIWDVDVFWGEFWFNSMVVFLLSGLLLLYFAPWKQKIWRISHQKEKKIFQISSYILLILLITMLTTWDYSFNIFQNWYTTQFAYQIVQWPALVGTIVIFILLFKKKDKSVEYKNPIAWILLSGFGIIFLYLSLITNFHPHAIFNPEYAVHYYFFTIGIPVSVTMFCLSFIKNRGKAQKKRNKKMIQVKGETQNKNDKNHNLEEEEEEKWEIKWKEITWFTILILSFGFFLLIQYLSSITVPRLGETQMFSMEFHWWWLPSHWPSYIAIISGTLSIIFGTRVWYHSKIIPKIEKIQGNEVEKSSSTNKKTDSKQGRGNLGKFTKMDQNKMQGISQFLIPTKLKKKSKIIFLFLMLLITVVPPSTNLALQWEQREKPMLLVNQVGYYPNSPKRIIFQTPGNKTLQESPFFIYEAETGSIAYQNNLYMGTKKYGKTYMVGNFSQLKDEGEYYATAKINGKEFQSHLFKIDENVYDKALEMAFRFFYYQRCNYEVKEVVSGYKGHEACHMDDAMVWNGLQWIHHDLTGGWHDAGDYNKYNSWFQTQWYCAEAMAEASLIDPKNKISTMSNLYDSKMTDALDETLWGIKYLMNCVNDEGIGGEDKKYLVWESVLGYRQQTERSARMSYWGPPEKDWTAPRRVENNSAGTTFMGYKRGYQIAGTILKAARMIDLYSSQNPNKDFPDWINTNTSYMRELAEDVFQKYLGNQGTSPENIESYIGKFLYYNEESYITEDYTEVDDIINEIIPNVNNISTYPLWFAWSDYYMLGQILSHYLNHNREVPQNVMDKINAIQGDNFRKMFDEPFRVKHVRYEGNNILFYGAERQTDMQTNVWIQALMSQCNASTGKPHLIQSYLDWIFGVNPVGYCLMEGVGDRNLPQYHHRYSNAENPGGEVPGAIPNGIAQAKLTDEYMAKLGLENNDSNSLEVVGDRGWVADWAENHLYRDGVPSNPNEVWIPHDAMFIKILTTIENYDLLR